MNRDRLVEHMKKIIAECYENMRESITELESDSERQCVKGIILEDLEIIDVHPQVYKGLFVVVFLISYEKEVVEVIYHSDLFFDCRRMFLEDCGDFGCFVINDWIEVVTLDKNNHLTYNQRDQFYFENNKVELNAEEKLQAIFYFGMSEKENSEFGKACVEYINSYFSRKMLTELEDGVFGIQGVNSCEFDVRKAIFNIFDKKGIEYKMVKEEEWYF